MATPQESAPILRQFKAQTPLWRNKDYLLLASGQAVSEVGTQVSGIAYILLVLALTHSPAQVGFIGAIQVLPALFLSLPAGVLVDRWNRKHVMILCDAGRALCLASIPIAFVLGHLTIVQLYLAALIESTLAIFFDLSERAALPRVVTQEQLSTVIAQNQAIFSTSALIGPTLSGALYSIGRVFPFLADALSYVVSVLSLLFIKTPFQLQRSKSARSLGAEMKEGLIWLWHQPVLRAITFLIGGLNLTVAGIDLIVVVLAQRIHASPVAIGLIFSIGSIGALAGAFVAPLIQKRLSYGQAIIGICWITALLWPLFLFASHILIIGVIFALYLIWRTISMANIPASSHIIDDLIHEWETPFVELAIFGTDNGQEIARYLNAFCEQTLHSGIAEYLFYESSQGAVCGVQLADGRRVVIKAHQPRRSIAFLQAVYQAQRYLAEHDYPCPLPLVAPTPLVHGHAMIETLLDAGEYMDAHIPAIRRSMAQHLAQLAAFTPALKNTPGLASTAVARQLPSGVLWPTPHNKIFDFEATTKGAEWIDQLAREAKQVLDQSSGEQIIGHTDWSVKHFRFLNGKVTVIYDWDSLALERETLIVASAAISFTMTWHLNVRLTPTPEEARAFITEYEEARRKAFTPDERRTMNAAVTYSLAYGARCYHSIQRDANDIQEGTALETLMQYKGNFLGL